MDRGGYHGRPLGGGGRKNDFSNVKDDDGDRPSSFTNPLWGYLLFFILCGGGIFSLYTVIFPDRPSYLDVGDKDKYNDLFFSGKPTLVLCTNKTLNIESIGTAMNKAVRDISDKGKVLTYYVNCNTPLANGRTIFTTHNLRSEHPPVMFLIGNGKKPVTISPYMAYNSTEIGKSILQSGILRANKHTRIDNDHDYDNCIRERSGGCLILYTPNTDIHKNSLLTSLPDDFRLVQFALLRANLLTYKTNHATLESLMKQAVRDARNNALASTDEDEEDENDDDDDEDSLSDEDVLFGTKPKPKVKKTKPKPPSKASKAMVLIHAKRIINKGDSGYGKSSSLLITVHPCSSSGLTKNDVALVLEKSKQSALLLKETNTNDNDDDTSKGNTIEALLERDDKLLSYNSTLVSRGDITFQRVVPKATPTPAPRTDPGNTGSSGTKGNGGSSSSSNQPRRVDTGNARVDEALKKSDQRKAERQKRNHPADIEKEYARHDGNEGQEDRNGEGTTIDLDNPEDQAEWERQRRQRMMEEEQESGFVAHAAEEDGGNTDSTETTVNNDEIEEVTDLDETNDHHPEEEL